MRENRTIWRRIARRALQVGLITVLMATSASADLNAHLTLTIGGQAIPGGATQAGREGTIVVPAFSFPGFSPVSAAGVAGPAQSRPVTATVEIDQATPLLAQAWADGGTVTAAVFRFYRPHPATGVEENYLTITLSGGKVSSFTLTSPDSNDADLLARPATAHVGFTYANVNWTFESPSTSVSRTWQDGQ